MAARHARVVEQAAQERDAVGQETRKRTRIQEANEERILDAALEVFSSYGFRGATVDQVASSIGAITDSVTRVKGIVDEVREASRQQTDGMDQVSHAISQMEKVTQTTAATAEESAAASEELNAQAESAMKVVRELERLVGAGQRDNAVQSSREQSIEPAARIAA